MPITYHLQNLTYLSEHETKKKYPPLTPADSALQHSTSELQNLHWAVSYPRFIWEKYSAYCEDWKMSKEGGGGRRRKRKRRRRRRRGWWCQKEERGRVNRKITVDKGVGGNHEMDWRKLTCDLRFITPTSVDSSKRDRGIKMVSNCSHLLYTRISLH